jgi:membrane protease YdiL (CAAX protease family)
VKALRYSVLAYAITWLLVLPLVLEGLGVGVPEISPLWHGLGALGPVTAAFLMRRSENRSFGLRDLYRPRATTCLSRPWTGLLLLSPLLLLGFGFIGVTVVTGAPDLVGLAEAISSPEWLGSVFVGSVLYGLGEEPGWRGWLLPYFQRDRGAVTSTLLVGAIWGGWHAPFFAYRFELGGPGMVVGFFVGLLAGALWLTFVFNSTGGSVWVVAVWHVLWNVSNFLAAAVSDSLVAVLNGLMMVLGFGVAVVWGRRELTVGGGGAVR